MHVARGVFDARQQIVVAKQSGNRDSQTGHRRAEAMAADEWRSSRDLVAERGERLGQPVEAVGVAAAVLRVAVGGQVAEDQPEAVPDLLGERFELTMREARRVDEHQRRAGAVLAIGDPDSVARVE